MLAIYLTFLDISFLFCETGITVSMQTSQHAVHAQLGRVARLEPLFTGGQSRLCFHSSPHTSPRPDGGRISECHELWPGSPAYFPVAPPEACALRLALSCTAVAESDFHGMWLPSGYWSGMASGRCLQMLRAGGCGQRVPLCRTGGQCLGPGHSPP